MGKKKMNLSSIFKTRVGGSLPIPLCYNAKTLSFRVGDDMIKTVNSVFFDHHHNGVDLLEEAKTPESWFTNSSETASHSTESDQDLDAESLEMVVRGVVRSERLFFDPGVTSSILEEIDLKSKEKRESKKVVTVSDDRRDCGVYSYNPPMESEESYGDFPNHCDLKSKKVVTVRDSRDCGVYSYNQPIQEISVAVAMESEDSYGDLKSKKVVTVRDGTDCGVYSYNPPIEEISVAVAMESEDPYGDFRRSMEEMVMNHCELAKDWESLESMLAWYLKMNERKSHSVIVSAFVDLVSGFSDSGAGSSLVLDSARYSTAVESFMASPVNSLSHGQREIEEEEEEERRSC